MNIYTSQASIVAALTTAFTALEVRWIASDLPEAQNQYQLGVPNERVWVVYKGSTADPSITNQIAQDRKVSFAVEIYSKSLYDSNGVMAIRDVIEQVLIGFKPTSCQRLYLVKDELTITEDRIWAHVLQLECKTLLVQKEDSDPIVINNFLGIENTD